MALVKHNNNSISNVTSFAQIPAGKPVLLSTATASASASIEFTSGIDSSYDIYQFEFNSIHPATDNVKLQFNLSTDGGSNYNVTKTSTYIVAFNKEDNTGAVLEYGADHDLAQSTSDQQIMRNQGNAIDESMSGTLTLLNPSSNTYVKHWISRLSGYNPTNRAEDNYSAGYGNTTSAVNAIIFRMSSGTFDGTIKMYGISA